ncbi:unnamed protein product [Schistosoma turkestanicum]|nr:unnamed protein product [Schistosoma turkestanicum]
MDSKVNFKEHIPKVHNHEFVDNEHTSYLSKMPAATAEQLTIAKVLSRPDNDVNIRCYVVQLQELTKCSEDQAVTALYDCENNIERAVELVLDQFRCGTTEEWHTTVSKRGKTKHTQSVSEQAPDTLVLQKKASKPKLEKSVENQDRITGQNGPVSPVIVAKNPNSHPEKFKKSGAKKRSTHRTDTVPSERVSIPPQSHKNDALCNTKQFPVERKNRNESEAWDPYADCGEWEGDSIEIVNSNASIAMGLQEAVSLMPELFHDDSNYSEKNLNADDNSHVDAVQNLTKDPDALDAESLFVSVAKSKPPPRAFAGKLDVSLFFAPELLPNEQLNWKPTFGGESLCSKFGSNAATILSPGKIGSNADEPLRVQNDSRTLRTSKDQPECSPKQFAFPQISQQSHPSDFEIKNTSLGVLLDPPSKTEEKVSSIAGDYPSRHEQMVSKVALSYPVNHNKQPPSIVARTTTEKPNYLEPAIKNYLLEGLPDNMSKMNVGEVSGQSTKDQFPIQNNAQPSLAPFSHGQNDQHMIPPHLNKIPASHASTHVSGHTQQVNNNTQATHLPPGMPHFISQFAPPAYHMFNLPGGSSTTSAIFDLDHLQLLQQQRMLYDMHLQHQAATTAQSLLTANADSSTSVKPVSHNLSNSMGHVTAANTGMRPDMLTTALGHTPQMMTHGHPYFPYPGFVLMNGYPNPFLNQQQPNSDNSQVQNPGQCASPITQHQTQLNQAQSYNSLKQLASGVGNYEDLLDVKYGDPPKQVGFKNSSNPPNYSSFQSQGMSLDAVSGKLSSASHSNNGSLVQNFNHGNTNSHAQHFSPQFYASASGSPYINTVAAAVAAAAAAKHGPSNNSAVSTNQSNPNIGVATNQAGAVTGQNQIHLTGNPSQGMVLGNTGQSLHHHQRAPIPHPQH